MNEKLLRQAPSIEDLKKRANKRIPKFAFDYVVGGCNDNVCLQSNRKALDAIQLAPSYLTPCPDVECENTIFGKNYSAPFGIAPIGLSGIVWPNASLIHAKTAHTTNIPFILSSVSTVSIEKAAEQAKDNFWFQLYPPKDRTIRSDLLKRIVNVGCKTLVVTIDVPSLSWRPLDIKNGLAIPPRISAKSLVQSVMRPAWSLATLKAGIPQFETLRPYLPESNSLRETARLIRHTLREIVDASLLKEIRKEWHGNLVVKGINSLEDANIAYECGADGIIVSNHGGRQLDAAQSPIGLLPAITDTLGDKLVVMADSGVNSGVDIARFIACGAKMVFAGRAFLYGISAFSNKGGIHSYDILYGELKQLLEQLRCPSIASLPKFLVK